MKRVAALVLALGLLLGISGFTAGAANGVGSDFVLEEEVLYSPGAVSESGEVSVGWVPESLDPEAVELVEELPSAWESPVAESVFSEPEAESFAAGETEDGASLSEESVEETTSEAEGQGRETIELPGEEAILPEEDLSTEENSEENPEENPEEEPEAEPEAEPEENPEEDPEADPEENPEGNLEEDPEENPEADPEEDPEEDPEGDAYDTTDSLFLPVRNQGGRDTCWAMAALACAEYYALGHGYADSAPDYSEWALAYFSTVGFRDNRGNAGLDTHDYNTFEVFSAGNIHRSTMSLACWLGPVSESDSNTVYSKISENREPETLYARDYDAMHLENAYWLTAATDTDRAVLKQKLREKGAGVLCMYYVGSYLHKTQDEDGIHYAYYNADEVHDSYGNLKTNHEVTVVGWDDDYPAEYFDDIPPGDGAWKCRNSYGSSWGENGYFWVSYYDATAMQSAWAVFEYGSADNYDLNYQYDCCTVVSYVDFHQSRKDSNGVVVQQDIDLDTYANVFTAGSAETLKAVSTYTYNPGVSYTLRIYTGLNGTTPTAGGKLVLTQTGCFDYAGFHTVVLDKQIQLAEDEHFSVVFTVGDDSTGGRCVPTCSTRSDWKSVNAAEAGQSFYSTYNCAKTNKFAWSDFSKSSGSNFRIKAYTDCAEHEEHYVENLCEVCGAYGYLNGDYDGDGERNVLDLLALLRYQLGERDFVYASADLTGDGSSDVADLVRLLRGLCGVLDLGITSK